MRALTRHLVGITRLRDETGAATAEYAITIMAAVGFAGLLVVIMRSGEVQGILSDLVHRALTVAG
jgi:Flp pilus assembly pilin Flp